MDQPWERDGVKASDDWAALVFVLVGDGKGEVVGYIVVIEPTRPNAKYKMAGGHCEEGETPLETAKRELLGEAGLGLSESAFRYVNSKWRDGYNGEKGHWSILFAVDATMEDVAWMSSHQCGNEGEEPKFFTSEEFAKLVARSGLLPPHQRRLKEAGLYG